MISTIWQRYLFAHVLRGLCFFLLSFFLLYSIIDFSTHSQDFLSSHGIEYQKLCHFYLYQLIKRLELLLPLAFLIATIRTLVSCNLHKELVALQVSGQPIRKIIRPLWAIALVCTAAAFVNEEYFLPSCATSSFAEDKPNKIASPLHHVKRRQFHILSLKDSSKLIYQRFQKEENSFFDVYWIRSIHDIWRMKYLDADPTNPVGHYVDHITRNAKGHLEKVESFEQIRFPYLEWDLSLGRKKNLSVKYKKPSHLLSSCASSHSSLMYSHIQTHLFRKIATPFLPFFILMGIVPCCTSYSRNLPITLIYTVSIGCFVLFFALLNALTIIGEHRIIHPAYAIFSPFILTFLLTCKRCYKAL